ncbi:bifunctional DNA-formamidopyrimidine glycosylase/DNA-(apurinic or apyrimidinic site) lyase [Acidiferrimicrobium sp. IK]|uniref:bifunctional DNA-formamidopyrimidine glycosylase/DNA-(apurinic or apyrimidinic site) lyase n=1 Tax=Acidiferrimicrobium sp. IK TaxID=2871700 RepID=UPI0021CB35BF|nr:bifunctional DNA-formamidopyrimidine glycosylase/DNA-(apurinic or apyrimidinic site) lyase [Acidiferrimicrobium sp. IK]MCU4183779.1 bifunctional DNA-formamidopyrimidine glycosylase/DNA-(apurinic or apyrimidinic site) lyase [Acidiferrimicrobium sp. IK]
MPELPEVETVRRGVAEAFTGRRITDVAATGRRTIRRHADAAELVGRSRGQVLDAVDRHGKYLMLRLGGGDVIVVHLGMSGQLLRADAGDPPPRHTHVVWSFDSGPELRFVDPRTFGEVFVTGHDPAGVLPELALLGPDALEGLPSWRTLAAVLDGRRTRLKPLLLDQHRIAGIGNIYADEILFAAKLAGDRPAESLTTAEIRRLHAAIGDILRTAVAHRGSSLADAQYRDVDGAAGDYQLHHTVYAREGQPCVRCGRLIVRRREMGRSSFSCPRCQR